ncbi:MAG: helix-turn-helix domain-containing protein [Candidatus Melainabacteria bacterium]|nr:helix-turn-helix domain-containing protein [Candidatus Melainabacteria bacterium]
MSKSTAHLYQPSLRQLLATDAFAEARVLCGQERLDRPVSRVVIEPAEGESSKALVIWRLSADTPEASPGFPADLGQVAGMVCIVPSLESEGGIDNGDHCESSIYGGLLSRARESDTPFVLVPGYRDSEHTVHEIEMAFISESRRSAARVQAAFINAVLEDGLDGVLSLLSDWTGCPAAVESAEFKPLASVDMGPTPTSFRKRILDESRRMMASAPDSVLSPIRAGKRVVLPLLSSQGNLAGLLSVTLRPTDEMETILGYMQPAALAAVVDLAQREKSDLGVSAGFRATLRDLLSGVPVSASEQERLERHFGFDLYDGFFVFAVEVYSDEGPVGAAINWPEKPYVSTEVEGTRIYVVPFETGKGKTWQKEAAVLVERLKKNSIGTRVQLGAGRKVATILELPESYRQARQALIIGSMIHHEKEFAIEYGALGVTRLLYLIIDHPELDRFFKETLQPLADYDEEWETELLDTLRVYVEQGANLNSAARALYVHRHTLRYRLEQIAEILEVDVDSQEVLLNFQVAFLIRQLKGNP